MPIYEYHCKPCDHAFEALIRSQDDLPRCPECGGAELAKQLSVPAKVQMGGRASSSLPVCESPSATYGCGNGGCGSGMCSFD